MMDSLLHQNSDDGPWIYLIPAQLLNSVASLDENGRAAVVLDTGAVSRGSGNQGENREKTIRRWFVENNFIDGVILLPERIRPS